MLDKETPPRSIPVSSQVYQISYLSETSIHYVNGNPDYGRDFNWKSKVKFPRLDIVSV